MARDHLMATANMNITSMPFQTPDSADYMRINDVREGETELRTDTSLDSHYMSILQVSVPNEDEEAARHVLGAVALAATPLSPSTIATLIGFPHSRVQYILQLITPLLVRSEDPDGPVQFPHQSLPRFVMDPTRCTDVRFHVPPDYHTDLCLRCFELMVGSLEENMFSIPKYVLNSEVEDLPKRIEESGIRGALEYACTSWHKHLVATTGRATDVISALHRFLEQKFLFWLEVLSSLDAVDGAVVALKVTVEWLNGIHAPTHVDGLLDTATDFLCFVTEFFEVISQSVPHIYQIALLFAPKSSVVRKLYGQHITLFESRIATDVPDSWDSPTTSDRAQIEVNCAVWSPGGHLVAVGWVDRVELRDSNTLKSLLILKPPNDSPGMVLTPQTLAFSPDGNVLACAYNRVRQGWGRSIPTPGIVRVWDMNTSAVINDISTDNFCEIAFSGIQTAITLIMGEGFRTYDKLACTQLCEGELLPSRNHQLGAHWVHGDSLRFAGSSRADTHRTISIYELRQSSNSSLLRVGSFSVPSHDGQFSFSPVSSHASFVTETGVAILNVQDSETIFCTKAARPLYAPPGRFSPDGRFFMCGTLENKILAWENTPAGYVLRNNLRPQLASTGFAFSPVTTSTLSWGPQGFELLHPANSAGGAHAETPQQNDRVVSRRATVEPIELLIPDTYPGTHGGVYQRGDQRACLPGTQETPLRAIKSWVKGPSSSPIFLLSGLVGTGKSAIFQAVIEWCDEQGILQASFNCSCPANQRGHLCPVFLILAFQLGRKHRGVRSVLAPILDSDPDIAHDSPSDQLEKLIVMPFKYVDVPAVIIIDGLDDLVDAASQSAILSAIEHCTDKIPKVKFLIISRPERHILDSLYFPLFSGQADTFDLYDTPQDSINGDIRLFLEHELSDLASRNGLDGWPSAAQLDLLVSRADGSFVYAVATVKFLGREHTSPGEQYAIIAHSPRDTIHEGTTEGVHRGLSLDSLCTSILQEALRNYDSATEDIMRSVLATVVLAFDPLPPSAIAVLAHLTVQKVLMVLRRIQPLLRLEEDPDLPVHLFHKMLPDLLTSIRCSDKKFYISPGKFHPKIALNCLKLMMNTTWEDGLSLQTSTPDLEARYPPALIYAWKHWHTHLAETRENVTALIPTLRRFLEEKWLKVLGVLPATDAASARDTIISWLREVPKDKRLLAIIEQT